MNTKLKKKYIYKYIFGSSVNWDITLAIPTSPFKEAGHTEITRQEAET
jgi:hypothetical protein